MQTTRNFLPLARLAILCFLLSSAGHVSGQGVINGNIRYFDPPPYDSFPFSANGSYDLDLNGSFDIRYETIGQFNFGEGFVNMLGSSRIAITSGTELASLAVGTEISSVSISNLGLGWGSGIANPGYSIGQWQISNGTYTGLIGQGRPLYLGFQFMNGADVHNGWISIGDADVDGFGLRIAYDLVPGESILVGQVPEPDTMLLMLLGIAGIMTRSFTTGSRKGGAQVLGDRRRTSHRG